MLEAERQWRIVFADFEVVTHRDAAVGLADVCERHGIEHYVYRRGTADSPWMYVA